MLDAGGNGRHGLGRIVPLIVNGGPRASFEELAGIVTIREADRKTTARDVRVYGLASVTTPHWRSGDRPWPTPATRQVATGHLDDKRYALDHIGCKLAGLLSATMQTASGRRLGQARLVLLEDYREAFAAEWGKD